MTQDKRGIKMNTLKRFDERYAQLIAEQAGRSADLTTIGFKKVPNDTYNTYYKAYGDATVTIDVIDDEYKILVERPEARDIWYPRISRGHYVGGPLERALPEFIEEIDNDLNDTEDENIVKFKDTLEELKADFQKLFG